MGCNIEDRLKTAYSKLDKVLKGTKLDEAKAKVKSEIEKNTYGSSPEHDGKWRAAFDRMGLSEQQKHNKWVDRGNAAKDFRERLEQGLIGYWKDGAFVTKMIAEEDLNVDSTYFQHMAKMINVIMDASKVSGVDLSQSFEMYQTDDEFTRADFDERTKKIRVFKGTQDSAISTDGELYLHEMIHAITEIGIKNDYRLTRKLERVQTDVLKQINKKYKGEGYKVLLEGIESPTNAEIDRAKFIFNDYIDASASEFLAYMMSNKHLIAATATMTAHPTTMELFPIDKKDGKRVFNMLKGLYNILATVVNKLAENYA